MSPTSCPSCGKAARGATWPAPSTVSGRSAALRNARGFLPRLHRVQRGLWPTSRPATPWTMTSTSSSSPPGSTFSSSPESPYASTSPSTPAYARAVSPPGAASIWSVYVAPSEAASSTTYVPYAPRVMLPAPWNAAGLAWTDPAARQGAQRYGAASATPSSVVLPSRLAQPISPPKPAARSAPPSSSSRSVAESPRRIKHVEAPTPPARLRADLDTAILSLVGDFGYSASGLHLKPLSPLRPTVRYATPSPDLLHRLA